VSINEQPVKENEPKLAVPEISKDGSFKRQTNSFTTPFGRGTEKLPVEAGRYRLIWCHACPWSHRAVIVRELLGLQEAISLGTVSPMRPDVPRIDWEFALDKDGVDPVLGIRYLSEIYTKTDPSYTGRPTVPAFIDVKKQEVVNNDYPKLTTYFETDWAPFHKKEAPDLYPELIRADIDALNAIIFNEVNNGVYKCGFAQSQEAYEEAFDTLFARLDDLEERLATRRFLFGDFITEADVRLYVTLARFDAAYYIAFKTNRHRLVDFPNLWGYARDLYETPGFGNTTDFDKIKRHYLLSKKISSGDQHSILPKGPDLSVWNTPHNRQHLSNSEGKFLIQG